MQVDKVTAPVEHETGASALAATAVFPQWFKQARSSEDVVVVVLELACLTNQPLKAN